MPLSIFVYIIIHKNYNIYIMQNIQMKVQKPQQIPQNNKQKMLNNDQIIQNQLSQNKQIINKQSHDHHIQANIDSPAQQSQERAGHHHTSEMIGEEDKNMMKEGMDQDKQQQSMPKNMKKTSKISLGGCNCLRSKCLKNYCECFNQGKKCSDQCKCTGCENTLESQNKNKNSLESLEMGERSCSCKKSNCLKKYCECFNNGFKCHKSCKCEDCRNVQNYNSRDQAGDMMPTVKQQSKKQKSPEEIEEINTKLNQILKKTPQEYQVQMLQFLQYLLS